MMKRLKGVAIATTLFVGSAGLAGAKWTNVVYITKNADGSGTFGGTLGSTRNTSDTYKRMGCYYEAFPTYKYSSCSAYDGVTSVSCSTTDPILNDTISKLQGEQYLWVQFDVNGICTRVQIGSSSVYPPKAP